MLMSTRARQDIQTAVAFLTTYMKKTDEENCRELNLMLKYLKGTRKLNLTLSVGNVSVVKWWVDASHEVHKDCRGRTRYMVTLGKGYVSIFSTKQYINGKRYAYNDMIGVKTPWKKDYGKYTS